MHFTPMHPCLVMLTFILAWALLSFGVEPKSSGECIWPFLSRVRDLGWKTKELKAGALILARIFSPGCGSCGPFLSSEASSLLVNSSGTD